MDGMHAGMSITSKIKKASEYVSEWNAAEHAT
jgi:hypothetical protein